MSGVHECCYPELPVDQESDVLSTGCEADDDAGHQVADDDEIADCHAKALDRNRRVEQDRGIRVCEL